LGEGTTYSQSSLHLTLENIDDNLYALSYGGDAIFGDLTVKILIPDYWYNISITRDSTIGDYKLYIDDVLISTGQPSRSSFSGMRRGL
jgi:hypothetical protein